MSSHILSEVSAVCDQILIISKGELVASDTPDGLQAKLKGAGELELCVKGTAAQLKTLLSNLDGVGKLYDDRSRRRNRARTGFGEGGLRYPRAAVL